MPTATGTPAVHPLPLRTRLAGSLGLAVGSLSRRVGAGSGGVIGGRVSLAIDPDALRRLGAGRRSVLVTGTNGKTTTTRLLAVALETTGPVATNLGGANLPAGIVTALARSAPGLDAAIEVDEAYLEAVAGSLRPEVVCLLNLSRDQLDRINEVRMLAARWRRAVASLPEATVIANADDPVVAWSAMEAHRVLWVAAGTGWTLDATGCPACGGRIRFAAGGWSCDCGLARPTPDVTIEGDVVTGPGTDRTTLHLGLPGRFNRANAAVALTAAGLLGRARESAAAAMEAVTDVSGRYRTTAVAGVPTRLLLAKNPAGWAELLGIIGAPPAPVVVAINARVADGRDPSWLWDVEFERLAGRVVVATGERCRDLAVRLRYAGVEHETVPDLAVAVRRAAAVAAAATGTGSPMAASAPEQGSAPVDVIANYTSFQQLLALSRSRG
ncbi:MAG TPA: DUF1727 domain-containing protein [Acidimicrobiales bacterium]|nr:DUF1727 domain-containing protein [Acidimicrobiales bacterium]